ncbi:Ig-like domain-containing protein [Oscillibacter sp.]|uniref:Ig-like domain-containing protein n=1 Tax=Oscillibacter sp. TaxID=1945593 RepID=UPI0026333E3F|nr:Ig-like domain-containing protein [Oscillibacter sp.]MDD3346349.1 Ig-like domain-containing protein [Oscillibacter sp.]
MAMKRCPNCGERYSDTYEDCPFCEEEEALQDGEEIRRPRSHSGHRVAGRQQMNFITPTLIVLIMVMVGLLVYLLWGDKVAEKFAGQKPVTPPTQEVTPVQPETPEEETPDPGVMPGESEGTTAPGEGGQTVSPETDYTAASKLPDGLKLSTTDFTLKNLGESHTITVSGGSGSYRWVSEDDGIASVDSSGKVTAVSGGTTNVLVSDGSKKGVCIVRITASGSLPSAPASSNSDNGSGGAHKLNREDMTLSKGEKFQLKLTGVTTALTWSTSNSAVATVAGDGTVTAVSGGSATITASWDGASVSCIVRVK